MYANPLELARGELGEHFDPMKCGPVTKADDERLMSLQIEARDHGFMNEKFWVNTAEGLVIPAEVSAGVASHEVKLIQLHDLAFAGVLKGFHKFSIGKMSGSWCMNFDESVLAPTMKKITKDKELWVPTAAVKKIEPL